MPRTTACYTKNILALPSQFRNRDNNPATRQFGDVKPVGHGVFEMREHFGPGWRMYYVQRGEVLIVMLGGGDKSTQSADIAKAAGLADMLEE